MKNKWTPLSRSYFDLLSRLFWMPNPIKIQAWSRPIYSILVDAVPWHVIMSTVVKVNILYQETVIVSCLVFLLLQPCTGRWGREQESASFIFMFRIQRGYGFIPFQVVLLLLKRRHSKGSGDQNNLIYQLQEPTVGFMICPFFS